MFEVGVELEEPTELGEQQRRDRRIGAGVDRGLEHRVDRVVLDDGLRVVVLSEPPGEQVLDEPEPFWSGVTAS